MNYDTVYRRKPGRRKGSVAHNKLNLEIVNARLAPRGIVCLGPYVDKETKAPMLGDCGHQWDARVGSVLRGRGCPECRGKVPLTKELVNARIAEKSIVCLDEVTGNQTKVRFKCYCGNIWFCTPDTAQRKSCTGCPECAKYKRRPKQTLEQVNSRLEGRGIKCVEFTRMDKKSSFRGDCGHEWVAMTDSVIRGCGCPECATFGVKVAEPCYLYLMYADEGGIANFGISKNIKIRRGQHSNDDGVEYQVLKARKYSTGKAALRREKEIIGNLLVAGEMPLDGSREKFRMPVSDAVKLFDRFA